MGWEKGKPRTRLTEAAREPIRKKVWTMKAKSNWEDATDESDVDIPLHIPKDQIPEGMDLRWVTVTVREQPVPQWRARAERSGWTPVHQEDFDSRYNGKFMQADAPGEINYDGLVLMARPIEMSARAKKRDAARAREQVQIKENALRGGDIGAAGASHPSALGYNRINRSYEPIPIPSDE